MSGIFNLDSPVMRFLGKVADIIILNLLWMLCSIPIVTIGASTTALYYVSIKMAKDEDIYIARTYFKAFKDNLKQATIIWLILLVALVILVVDIYVMFQVVLVEGTLRYVILGLLFLIAFIWLSVFMYVFALQSFFENTVKNTLKNAAIFGIFYFGSTIKMVVVDVVIILLGLRYIPLLAFSVPIYFNSFTMNKIFSKHIPQEEDREEGKLEDQEYEKPEGSEE